jgi:hypothetical protein
MKEIFSRFFFTYLLVAMNVIGIFYVVALPWMYR